MNLTAFVEVAHSSLITLTLSARPPGARMIGVRIVDEVMSCAISGGRGR